MIASVETAADILRTKKSILVLTGAGMSTASGIPDFRSKTGIYNKFNVAGEVILSRDYFFAYPERFYDFLVNALYYPDAKPNLGHHILARWEREGRVSHIVTQNIDGFHTEAGSRNVIEFHGTMRTATCQGCGKQYLTKELLESKEEDFFYCRCSGGRRRHLIKPDFVLFGEHGYWFIGEPFYRIQRLAHEADALLILGTSLQVYPFALIPEFRNAAAGTPIVIINRDETPLDHQRDVYVLHADIAQTLEEIDRLWRRE